MKNNLIATVLTFLISFSLYVQEKALPYQSKMADLGEIQLEYMDFGGEGIPLIRLQDMHNNFEGLYKDPERIAFWSRFTDSYRVLVPLRRGYGRSTKTDFGYDVSTQAEDLLKFMDFLGIEKAVLWARIPTTQDLIWIAEHHPDRVLGLIFLGNPLIFCMTTDPETNQFNNNNWLLSNDLEDKAVKIVNARIPYRPHCLDDTTYRIQLPTLRFWHQGDMIGIELGQIDKIERNAKKNIEGKEEIINYFKTLAKDRERIEHLRQVITACDLSKEIDDAMVRTFGSSMRTVVETDGGDYLAFREKHIREFLSNLSLD